MVASFMEDANAPPAFVTQVRQMQSDRLWVAKETDISQVATGD